MTKKSDAGRTILEILEVWFAAPSCSNFGCRMRSGRSFAVVLHGFAPKQHQSTAYRIQASFKKKQKKSPIKPTMGNMVGSNTHPSFYA